MIKLDTGSSIIHRFDEVIDVNTCKEVYDYMLNEKGVTKECDQNLMPWHENDDLNFRDYKDINLKNKVDIYRHLLTQLVCISFQDIVFPHLTNTVLWREGKHMGIHKDNGRDDIEFEKQFKPRKYSCVAYMNDDYDGGETFIKQLGMNDYVSTPKTGSILLFKSNEECYHGVNKIKSGNRVTLALWFTDNIQYAEAYNWMIK